MRYPDFATAVADDKIDTTYAALLFARNLSYPELDIPTYLNRIDDLADEAYMRINPEDELIDRVEGISTYLFGSYGFKGNTLNYGDPRNSYLNEVLDRQLGIPISLSALFLAVTHRLDIPSFGIGLPGHFIVGIDNPAGTLFLDPFHEGVWLSRSDCVDLVKQTTGYQGRFQRQWLRPIPPRLILARMLNNVRLCYTRLSDWKMAAQAIAHLRLVQPDVSEHVRDEGLVYFHAGRFTQAVPLLEAYLEREPEAPDAEQIKQGIAEKIGAWVRQN